MGLTDHGSVTGDVSVDATSNKVHVFNLTDDSVNVLEPSGCNDGDTVTLIFTSTSSRTAALGFANYSPEAPSPRMGIPWKIALTKVGSTWY